MIRHQFLRATHEIFRPRSYLEIGVSDGRSLTLSRTKTVAIDPAFKVTSEIACDLQLVKATSDEFFARDDALAHLPDGIDLAFIDGLHLFEFALRDFMNVEKYSKWTSAIVLDDMLPRTSIEAARTRTTVEAPGDVYKVLLVLRRYRPDLVCIPLNTVPTGLLLVFGADPANTVLEKHYDEIVAEFVATDAPEEVPPEILNRSRSADPEQVLASSVWASLIDGRGTERNPSIYLHQSVGDLIGTGADLEIPTPTAAPWPPRKAAPKPPPTPPPPPMRGAPLVRAVRWRAKKGLRRLAARL